MKNLLQLIPMFLYNTYWCLLFIADYPFFLLPPLSPSLPLFVSFSLFLFSYFISSNGICARSIDLNVISLITIHPKLNSRNHSIKYLQVKTFAIDLSDELV